MTFQAANIKYLNTSRGVAFSADLMLGGKAVGTIENEGNGGDTHEVIADKIDCLEFIKAVNLSPFMLTENYLEHLMNIAEGVPETARTAPRPKGGSCRHDWDRPYRGHGTRVCTKCGGLQTN